MSVRAVLSALLNRACRRRPKCRHSGPDWIHEIKHDGFRIMARRDAAGVRLITRNGNDFTKRFPLAAAAVAALPGRSCLIDGEAIACDDNGLAVFELIRRIATMPALSCAPSICSRSTARICDGCRSSIASIGSPGCCDSPHHGLVLNEHFSGDGAIIFKHVCKLGCEGIVSKRLGSPYRSGRSRGIGSRSRIRRRPR